MYAAAAGLTQYAVWKKMIFLSEERVYFKITIKSYSGYVSQESSYIVIIKFYVVYIIVCATLWLAVP